MQNEEKLIFEQAKMWVLEAGNLVRKLMSYDIDIEYKEHQTDLVTMVDREVEQFLLMHIQTYYPSHDILSEETKSSLLPTPENQDAPYLWIIDPIDGTTNFVQMRRDFCISVALCQQDRTVFGIVYDVASNYLYYSFAGEGVYRNEVRLEAASLRQLDEALVTISPHWRTEEEVKKWEGVYYLAPYVRGLRSYGSTTIELCRIADGVVDGYVTHHIYPWDYAAGRLFIEELGGVVTDLKGNAISMTYQGGVIAGQSMCTNN